MLTISNTAWIESLLHYVDYYMNLEEHVMYVLYILASSCHYKACIMIHINIHSFQIFCFCPARSPVILVSVQHPSMSEDVRR